VAIDAVVSDFAAGVAEEMVRAAWDCDLCVVEGQGSIGHPGFSGVMLSLLHGTCPDAMILVHRAGRTHYKSDRGRALPSLSALRDAYERAAALLHPARVVGVGLNSFGRDERSARDAAEQVERELGVPVCDVLREGCESLLAAVWSK
jgi:uncharacterized NAD-dependent epimerase/dehydratase family protein